MSFAEARLAAELAERVIIRPGCQEIPGPSASSRRSPPRTSTPSRRRWRRQRSSRRRIRRSTRNIAEEGTLVHERLAAEMVHGNQEYFDTVTKMRKEDFADWKKCGRDREA